MQLARAFVLLSLSGLLAVPSVSVTPASAAKKQPKNPAFCFLGDCGNNELTEELDKTSAGLIYGLARRPELMDLEYLHYFIGLPENIDAMHGRAQKTYYWYDANRRLQYELQTTEIGPGRVTESTFTAHLPRHDLTFDEVHKLFGEDCKHFFDSEAHPTKLYSLSQNTFLTFSSAPHSFRVTRARVLYKGTGLGKPTPQDMVAAQQQLKMRTDPIATGHDYAAAIQVLKSRLVANPTDPETHYLLARAYAKTHNINQSIAEYKYVLASAGGNDALRQQSEAALKHFHIIPHAQQVQRRTVMKHGGQRIITTGKDNSQAIDPSLGIAPIQGISF